SAAKFFTDNILDLGTFARESNFDLAFNFDLTASSLGSGFGEDFIFGAGSGVVIEPPPGAVPEPGTLALFGLGGALALPPRRPADALRRSSQYACNEAGISTSSRCHRPRRPQPRWR